MGVRRTPGVVRLSLEAKIGQVRFIDEEIDYANCAVFGSVIIEAFGKQGGLSTKLPCAGSSISNMLDQ